jgi:osmotically-inducible protein OsmY
MNRNQAPRTRLLTLPGIGLMAAALALSACSRDDRNDAAVTVDRAATQVEQKAAEVKTDVSRGVDNAQQAGSQAADRISDKVADASITTAVNAELAKDPDLSALQINVDTVDGRVQLIGKAPNQAALERATQLASAVNGVRSVDNKLVISM